MTKTVSKNHPACQVCGSTHHLERAAVVRPVIVDLIKSDIKKWSEDGWICRDDLNKYRHKYVQHVLHAEKGDLDSLETEVLDTLKAHEILSKNVEEEFETNLTTAQKLADKVAGFGGSWSFILLFSVMIIAWMFLNTFILISRPFDPYPYILLNLVLSCIAAVQAPIIMMSQNRQEERDRLRAIHDYQINLKSELEVRLLHQKIDHLLSYQWERLVEIQDVQMDLMSELQKKIK